ncbi:MAG: hypothetical protein WCO56_03985 [Verrucomicrobiota bacterium]
MKVIAEDQVRVLLVDPPVGLSDLEFTGTDRICFLALLMLSIVALR